MRTRNRQGSIVSAMALLGLWACATPAPRQVEASSSVRAASSEPAPLTEDWKPFAFLLGSWEAEGGGTPGASAGVFSFQPDVEGHVLVRRNVSVTPGGRHVDLLVLYQAEPHSFRAIYFDNEEHVIHYTVTVTDSPPGAEFITEEMPGRPSFRLSYLQQPDGTLRSKFEIAPPGAGFRTYLEGTARRSSPGP